MTPPIVVVGSYVQDLLFRTPQFPQPGETLIGSFKTGPGGKGSNQAIASNRAGGKTVFIGAVGDDAFAGVAKTFHATEGVDARWTELEGVSTGAASIVVDNTGQNEIVVALGACDSLTGADVENNMPESISVVVTQLETSLEASYRAMALGKERAAFTILNPAPMRTDFDSAILKHVDVLIPNETEFVALLKSLKGNDSANLTAEDLETMSEGELNSHCRALGIENVIVTLGKKGAFLSTPSRHKHFPALQDIKAIDTTGAGDAFVGGFAAGWVRFEGDWEQAIKYGIVVSGLSVTKVGTAPAMPSQEEVLNYLETHA